MIKSRRIRWAGHLARMEEVRSTFKLITAKPTLERPLGRAILKKYVAIRNWIDSAQDSDYWSALANVSLRLLIP